MEQPDEDEGGSVLVDILRAAHQEGRGERNEDEREGVLENERVPGLDALQRHAAAIVCATLR